LACGSWQKNLDEYGPIVTQLLWCPKTDLCADRRNGVAEGCKGQRPTIDHHGCQKRGFNLENQGRSITVIFDVRFQISALKIPHRRRRGVVLNIRGKRRSRPLTHLFRILSHQTHEGGEQRPAQDAQRQDGRFAAIGEMNGAITVIFAVLDTEGVSIISARPASITERRLLP